MKFGGNPLMFVVHAMRLSGHPMVFGEHPKKFGGHPIKLSSLTLKYNGHDMKLVGQCMWRSLYENWRKPSEVWWPSSED